MRTLVRSKRNLRSAGARSILAGAVLGTIILHPVMEVVFWFQSHDRFVTGLGPLWGSVVGRLFRAFTPGMLPMTGTFALIGGTIGWGFWRYAFRFERLGGTEAWLSDDPAPHLQAMLSAGEGERSEFKACARWDAQLGRVNRVLEDAVVRTIAGFLNHDGGTLLIGVTDAGTVAGLQADYRTLKRQDRDGFQQFLMGLIQSKLGGHVCAQVHVGFCAVQGADICAVTVEPSSAPVFCQDGSLARYFVRTGNGTRELDVREAIVHVARHQFVDRGGHARTHANTTIRELL